VIGSPRLHLRRLDSTNRRARELAEAGAPHGTLVTTTEQTAGRGRQGRTWLAPAGTAVLMSLVVRGRAGAPAPLTAAVAVCEACEAATAARCTIKWPNDVWIEGRKVAGILVEARPDADWAVIGIGVNVSSTSAQLPPELRGSATSLEQASPPAPGVEAVLAAVLAALARRLSDPREWVLEAWRSRDVLRGEQVRWAHGEGRAGGIDDAGRLLVERPAGIAALDAGEVHLVAENRL